MEVLADWRELLAHRAHAEPEDDAVLQQAHGDVERISDDFAYYISANTGQWGTTMKANALAARAVRGGL